MIKVLQQQLDTITADLINAGLGKWAETLPQQLDTIFATRPHGKLTEWEQLLEALPDIQPSQVNLNTDTIKVGEVNDTRAETRTELEALLKQLCPWRKGPYELFGIHIDTEWHSDWKWRRIRPHISPLENRSVLDVGCGNGYHMWRMLGEGARVVIGADPSQFFLIQFQAIKKYIEAGLGQVPAHLLPFKSEELPAFNQVCQGRGFDTVFSMGVLYHRISPIHHLQECRTFLRPGGELVLETLVIEGEDSRVLLPEERYAKMRNVWFIPTPDIILRMLDRAGFKQFHLADLNQTTVAEQRATEWMNFESLADFLDPNDPNKTVEGYPAPLRATFICHT